MTSRNHDRMEKILLEAPWILPFALDLVQAVLEHPEIPIEDLSRELEIKYGYRTA